MLFKAILQSRPTSRWMSEEHAERDRPIRKIRVTNLEGKRRADIAVERKLALLRKLKDRHGKRSSRERGKFEERVGRDAVFGGGVAEAVGTLPGDCAVLHDHS
jgi:hypothetical protein